jgi:hypothetical protein
VEELLDADGLGLELEAMAVGSGELLVFAEGLGLLPTEFLVELLEISLSLTVGAVVTTTPSKTTTVRPAPRINSFDRNKGNCVSL